MISINHAILGMLSYKSLTGYDIKKVMQESSFMYWSGNNNQIYKALVELHDEGLVTNEVYHQDSSPSKKVYTITDDGLAELKRWSQSVPEAPEMKKSFLVQLAWTDQLSNDELETLLARYEQGIKGQISIEQGKVRKGTFAPNRTPQETAIWDLIYENVISSYIQELDWINKVRQTVNQFGTADYEQKETEARSIFAQEKGMNKMTYQVIERNNQKYILLDSIGKPIQTLQDGLELVSVCVENGTNLLFIQGERLSDDFIRLSTGVLGAILQKFTLYNIKAVTVLDKDKAKGKFRDFLSESNRGSMFRAYTDFTEAENWLLSKNESDIG